MKKLFDEYNIDYIIHGDDPCILPDGIDAYALAKKVGRYKQIKRTEGVSSTDIVGRMLLSMRDRSTSDSHNHSSLQRQFSHGHGQKSDDSGSSTGTCISNFLPTSRRIVQFSNGKISLLEIPEHRRKKMMTLTSTVIRDDSDKASEQFVHVNQDTGLNDRVFDLRTPANQGIFCNQYQVEKFYKNLSTGLKDSTVWKTGEEAKEANDGANTVLSLTVGFLSRSVLTWHKPIGRASNVLDTIVATFLMGTNKEKSTYDKLYGNDIYCPFPLVLVLSLLYYFRKYLPLESEQKQLPCIRKTD